MCIVASNIIKDQGFGKEVGAGSRGIEVTKRESIHGKYGPGQGKLGTKDGDT